MFRYFTSIGLIIFSCLVCFAQEPEAKKPTVVKVKQSYSPTGLRVGTDVIALIRSRDNSFKGWEVNFDTDFYRYYLTVDYGYWATKQQLGNGNYQNNGNYIRFGADVNFLMKDPDRNMFFLGYRYGQSTFSESINYTNTASYAGFGSTTIDTSNANVTGHWMEVTSGLRVKIISGFWMGFTARLKFAPSATGGGLLVPYDMPGYGIISKDPYWGFNYQLFWRIPLPKFKKDPIN